MCAALARASPSCLSRFRKKNGEDKQNQSQILYPHRAEQWLCGTPFSTHTHNLYLYIYIPILTFLHGDKRERQVLSVLPSLSFFAWLHKLLSGDGFRQVTDPSFPFFLFLLNLFSSLPWAPLAQHNPFNHDGYV